ncbi:MAG: hypothetical protein J7485_10840 [Sphingobium sp.]|nr:hypothetical protein [Sphingobium sp.]
MMQWIVSLAILVAAFFLVPASMRSMQRSRKGRAGILNSFADGMATSLDPSRKLIVEEMEKRQNEDGEEVGGEEEKLK